MKPHKHCEVIKAWAEGKEIQCATDEGQWFDTVDPVWDDNLQYRIKPPAPKWPETKMSGDSLSKIYASFSGSVDDGFVAVANAALAHACETGLVLPVFDGRVTIPKGVQFSISGLELKL